MTKIPHRFIWASIACLYFWYYGLTFTDWHFIDSANLIFHEAGHTIFSFFGEFIKIAAGSGLQLMIPLFAFFYFFYTQQKISSGLCLLWTGQNLLNISIYVGDAVLMQLNLLGGDGVIHDWNYLLDSMGLIQYTNTIASCFYWSGWVFIILGTILALYYSWRRDTAITEVL